MMRHHFRRGLELQWRGRHFVIERRSENGNIQVKDISNNEFLTFPEKDMVDALFDGKLEIIDKTDSSKTGGVQFVDDLILAKESHQKEAKRRFCYIEKCISSKINTATKEILEPIILLVSKEIKDLRPPSEITLYRWLSEYKKAEHDVRALIPKFRKGNTARNFGKSAGKQLTDSDREHAREVTEIVDQVINEKYLSPQKLTVQGVYDLLKIRIAEKNRFREEKDKLPTPGKTSIYEAVAKLDEYEKDKARLGKRIADQKHAQYGMGPRPTLPLQRIEIDHTKVDLFIVDDVNRLPIGRPLVTTSVDKYSKMIVGRYVSFEAPGSHSVLQCLKHGIYPKTYLRELFPKIENDWEVYGIPESIACDNGMEFLGKHYADACLQLGIHIDYSPVRQPWYKSTIERFFGVQNKELLHRLPGTSFSNIFEKGDYDPKKNAVITFSSFLEILDTWIVDIYSREAHRGYEHTGLKGIPAETWREGVANFPPALPASTINLDVLLRMIEYRTIDSSGIELFSLRYNDPKLSLLRQNKKGEKFLIKYDPSDLGLIYVADIQNGTYIPVPALDQLYASGLSLWQHEIIKKYTRREIQGKVNHEALVRAKAHIQAIVEREFHLTKKTKTRIQGARWMQINSKTDDEVSSRSINDNSAPKQINGNATPFFPQMNIEESLDGAEIRNQEQVIKPTSPNTVPRESSKESTDFITDDDMSNEAVNSGTFDETDLKETIDLSGWGADFDLPGKK